MCICNNCHYAGLQHRPAARRRHCPLRDRIFVARLFYQVAGLVTVAWHGILDQDRSAKRPWFRIPCQVHQLVDHVPALHDNAEKGSDDCFVAQACRNPLLRTSPRALRGTFLLH